VCVCVCVCVYGRYIKEVYVTRHRMLKKMYTTKLLVKFYS
jgi:hypothetical protein